MLPARSTSDIHGSNHHYQSINPLGSTLVNNTVVGTGFSKLNDALEQGGWPESGLIELLCAGPCPQSLRLLLPVMAARQDRLALLANPPARPRADTLQQAGIASHRLLVMRSPQNSTLLDACCDAARSGEVAILVIWLPELMDDHHALKRLHLAAREGDCLLVAIRTACHARQPSPASLRLRLRTQPPAHLGVEIIKQPGGWGGKKISLTLLQERLPTASPAPTRLRETPAHGNRGQPHRSYQDPTSRFSRPRIQQRNGTQNLPF